MSKILPYFKKERSLSRARRDEKDKKNYPLPKWHSSAHLSSGDIKMAIWFELIYKCRISKMSL
ncbi:MAG: hypothetical protein EAX96_21235 [Candidatus Lokiarchaeota archaeon]|nr:hypothetical protein [Candidatus Lokiarchaeota archaeon]